MGNPIWQNWEPQTYVIPKDSEDMGMDMIMVMDLEKAEEAEIKLPTSVESSRKKASSRKTSNSALLTIPKPLTVRITINCGKLLKR